MAEQNSVQAILNAVYDPSTKQLQTNATGGGGTTNASIVNAHQVNASQLSSPWITNASVVNAHQVNASQLSSPWITNSSLVTASNVIGKVIDTAGNVGGVQGGAADNAVWVGNPVRVGGVYQSATQTYAASDVSDLQVDVNGNLKVREQYAPGYEDNTNNKAIVEHRYSYANVTASGATVVKASAGFLHSITFNQPVSGVTTVITDNTAAGGTAIGTVVIPTGAVNGVPFTLMYNVVCSTGITASQVSGIATGSNLTVAYR